MEGVLKGLEFPKETKFLWHPACLHNKLPHVQHQIIWERCQTSCPAQNLTLKILVYIHSSLHLWYDTLRKKNTILDSCCLPFQSSAIVIKNLLR